MPQEPLNGVQVGTGTDSHTCKRMPEVMDAEIIDAGNLTRLLERFSQVVDVSLFRALP
jgi:hypothetical protein